MIHSKFILERIINGNSYTKKYAIDERYKELGKLLDIEDDELKLPFRGIRDVEK